MFGIFALWFLILILFKIAMGILVGTYYTIHFINCGTLYECIFMHLVNNFLSSLLSRSTSLEDIGKIDVVVQCKLTALIFGKHSSF